MQIPKELIINDIDGLWSPPSYISVQSYLTEEECADVIRVMDTPEKLMLGSVGDGKSSTFNAKMRVVYYSDIFDADVPWLKDKLKALVIDLNKQFQFDLYGLLDEPLFMKYVEAHDDIPAGHFNWHIDTGRSYTALRKISISINLNDPEEYEGGELRIFDRGEVNLGKSKKGSATAFPSYINHKVTPVTKGCRYSIVLFVIGPRIR